MIIKVEKKVTEEKEITLPFFCKTKGNNLYFYKIYSEESCIQVQIMLGYGIQTAHSHLALHLEYEPCTEDDFLEAYNTAINNLENLI